MIARHLAPALALGWILGACGAAPERPEPPSGAVDPGIHGLATPGAAPATPPAPSLGPSDIPGSPAVATPRPEPRPAAPAEPVSEATGKIVMTREHCETLGRKFAELTLQQGGALGALAAGESGEREAAGVSKTFSDGCVRDLVGQPVEAREYQCMLRAQSPDGLLACKR